MDNRNEKTFETFHKAIVNVVLWLCAAILAFISIRNIMYGIEDNVDPLALVIIDQIILFGSAILLVKARFDLAKRKLIGAKEILIAGLAAAVAFFCDWRIWDVEGELLESSFLFPLLSACWSIAVYRYYMLNRDRLNG